MTYNKVSYFASYIEEYLKATVCTGCIYMPSQGKQFAASWISETESCSEASSVTLSSLLQQVQRLRHNCPRSRHDLTKLF